MSDKKKKRGLHPADIKFIKSAATGEGLIALTPEMLPELCNAAKETGDVFKAIIKGMTLEQAQIVRRIRVDEDASWRSVAQEIYDLKMFKKKWSPPSNQIMGMMLCETAAEFFGENYMESPWN